MFNLEGDPSKLLEIETKIKYNESIIRHLFLVVKEHVSEDSSLLIESRNKKPEISSENDAPKKEVKIETPKTEVKEEKSDDAKEGTE